MSLRYTLVHLATDADATVVQAALRARGARTRALVGEGQRALLVLPGSAPLDADALAQVDGVARVLVDASPHPLVDALARGVRVAGHVIGAGAAPVLLAGPCAVESREHTLELAGAVAARGAAFLRGGAFKPRTSPYDFAGHGERALDWLREAADRHGLGVVTEAVSEEDVARVRDRADLVQVGSRNMHSPGLLRAVGGANKPVLLKRGMSATLEEWLLAGERLLLEGAPAVVFCERGVRGFDPSTRNVLDVGAIAELSGRGLPVVADPSHAAGRRDLVLPLARAALAAGAHGVMIEVHDRPGEAASDGAQALRPEELAGLLATPPGPRLEDGPAPRSGRSRVTDQTVG